MLTQRRPSRSTLANQFENFARLYDPGNDEPLQEQPARREIPKRVKDNEKRLVSMPLKLRNDKYVRYRLTRVSKHPHCAYCGCELTIETSSLDHVLPQSKGGDNWPQNLLLSCHDCNSEKSSKTFEQWLTELHAVADRPLAIIQSLKKLINDGLENCLPHPVERIIPRKQEAGSKHSKQEVGVEADNFRIGRRWFNIVRASDKKVLVRDLRGTDLRHYLEAVGFDNNGPILLVAQEFWHPIIGGDVIFEEYPTGVASD